MSKRADCPSTTVASATPEHAAIVRALRELTAEHRDARRSSATSWLACFSIASWFFAEINPLFVGANDCVAGDAKLVVDLNAAERQPEIVRLIEARPTIYPDAIRKLRDGFDYVEVDPKGEIGLLTTGAGLSMMLIDEMTARGGKPLNFCDIRTGLLRGDPARLIKVLGWIRRARRCGWCWSTSSPASPIWPSSPNCSASRWNAPRRSRADRRALVGTRCRRRAAHPRGEAAGHASDRRRR